MARLGKNGCTNATWLGEPRGRPHGTYRLREGDCVKAGGGESGMPGGPGRGSLMRGLLPAPPGFHPLPNTIDAVPPV
jgi:hypothetical protein